MDKIIAPVVILFALVIALKLVEQLLKKKSGGAAYKRKQKLFSDAERSFLGVLDQILGTRYRIFGKIRLADIVITQAGLSNAARASAFNRICSRHVDFVLCDRDTLKIVAAVELDDASHESVHRQKRDKFVDETLHSAGVPFVRFKAQRAYNPNEVRDRISEVLSG
jgi:Protein of unknown function (DUF2726)